jgi:hypothetical protein
MRFRELLVAVILTSAASVAAQTTWNGTVSNDWHDAGNWSASVPTQTADAVISSAATNMPRIQNYNAQARALTIESGATLTIEASSNVTRWLQVHGAAEIEGTLIVDGSSLPEGADQYVRFQHDFNNEGTVTILGSDNGARAFIEIGYVASGASSRSATNSGTITTDGRTTHVISFPRFTNEISGTMNLENAGVSLGTSTVPRSAMIFRRDLTNQGTFTRSGTGDTTIYGSLTNAGTINSTSGKFRVFGNLHNTGTFTLDSSHIHFEFTSNLVLHPDSSIDIEIGGNGTWNVNSGVTLKLNKRDRTMGTVGDVLLTDDLDFGQTGRISMRGGRFELNGHSLTLYEINTWQYTDAEVAIILDDPSASIDVVNLALHGSNLGGLIIATDFEMTDGQIRVRGNLDLRTEVFRMDGGELYLSGGPNVQHSLIQFGEITSDIYINDLRIDLHQNTQAIMWSESGTNVGLDIRGNLSIADGTSLKYFGADQKYLQIGGDFQNDGELSPWEAHQDLLLSLRFTGAGTLSGNGSTEVYDLEVESGASLTVEKDIHLRSALDVEGAFNATSGTVRFVFPAVDSVIRGSNTFHGLSCAGGKLLEFEAGTTQTVTGPLTLEGTPEDTGADPVIPEAPVMLRSTQDGSTWTINATGSHTVSIVDVKDSVALTTIDASDQGTDSGNNTNWLFADMLGVSAIQAGALNVFADDTGGGEGLQAAAFTLTNAAGSSPTNVTSVEIQAGGTGDSTTAFTEVALYVDTGGTGSFDPGADTLYGTAATAFPQSGSLTFTGSVNVPAGTTMTMFVVVKLDGSPLALAGDTFTFTVTDVDVSSGTVTGTPAASMTGIEIATPSFDFTDISATSPETVYAGGENYVMQQFEVHYPGGPDNEITEIVIEASGTGAFDQDYTKVALYRDDSGTFDATTSTLIDSHAAFPTGGILLTFELSGTEAEFSAGDLRTYFVVVSYALGATHNATYSTHITAVSGVQHGADVNDVPTPGGAVAGHELLNHSLVASFNGPTSYTSIDSDSFGPHGDGELLLDFTMESGEEDWAVTSMTFTASGSGDHDNAYSEVALYIDTGSGTWEGATVDTLAAPVELGFTNDEVTFNLTDTNFPAATTRRYFLVGKFNGSAIAAETYNARLESIDATPPTGGFMGGTPTSTSTALIIDTAVLTIGNAATISPLMHKAGDALTHVIASYNLSATNEDIEVSSIGLSHSGSGDWANSIAATNGVQFWLDNGDGTFNPALDTLLSETDAIPAVGQFGSSLVVQNNSTVRLWVVVHLTPQAGIGATLPISFNCSVANESDVAVGSTHLVMFGTNPPTSGTLSVVDFFVTSFAPTFDAPVGGEPITIIGSGFMSPFRVFIDGVECPGNPVISADGTTVTGLTVPAGSGTNLMITVNSGALPAQTLGQTFDYFNVVGGGNGNGGNGGGGGCASTGGTGGQVLLVLLAIMGAALVLHRRRPAANQTQPRH